MEKKWKIIFNQSKFLSIKFDEGRPAWIDKRPECRITHGQVGGHNVELPGQVGGHNVELPGQVGGDNLELPGLLGGHNVELPG